MVNNTNMNFKNKLPNPEELMAEIPISNEIEEIKLKKDKEISDVFKG